MTERVGENQISSSIKILNNLFNPFKSLFYGWNGIRKMPNFWKLNFIPLNFHGDNDVGLIYHIKVEESSLTLRTGVKSSRSNACGHALIGKPGYDGNKIVSFLELKVMGLNMKNNRI